MCQLKIVLLMSLQHNLHSKPPFNISVLHSIAPLSPALFIYRYYFRVCPFILLQLGLLWVGCYEIWRYFSLLKALQ